MAHISFDATPEERRLVRRIAARATAIYIVAGAPRDYIDIEMDLLGVHANGCPLDFARLIEADDFNLMHDVGGIYRHLDRETGTLTNHFRPRFCAKERVSQ